MKKILPKHLRGRGLILLQLIPKYNIPKGVDINVLMNNLIILQLKNKNGDIRDIGIQITTHLYTIYGNKVVQILESDDNLNDFIKESLNNSFQQSTGNINVLQRDPKSIKEQSRPSKTMSKTTDKKPINNHNQNNKKRKKKKKLPAPATTKKQQEIIIDDEHDDEHDDEADDICNFCGLKDNAFIENEENLDLHYWQSCPMLTSCKLCEQVIEIATLHQHILTECESNIKHSLCKKCNIPYPQNEIENHTINCNQLSSSSNDIKCPLCLNKINEPNQNGWKIHLLKYPGCKSNPRPLLQ